MPKEKQPSRRTAGAGASGTNTTLTCVDGIEVGHAHDLDGLTGCTAVLCRGGATAAVDIVGSAPGTRQTESLRPGGLVRRIHAVCLSGGSAFGLQSCDGVSAQLVSEQIGLEVGGFRIPIVPGAVIFDLGVGSRSAFPDREMGGRAARAATDRPVAQGCVGAGCGATVGKLLGRQQGCKSGLGSFSAPTGDTLQVAALAVVNAFGDVRDPDTGRLVAGARETITSHRLADSGKLIRRGVASEALERARGESTTLGLVATNARLAPLEAQKVAKMASAAFHSTISPSATMVDGDLCFCLSTGGVTAELHRVGLWARFALERAILQAVLTARSAAGLPAARDL